MIESGDYINPSFNYQPRFNKPVLSYWAVAASYHFFGVSERSERLPIAVAGVVLIATAFGLGRAVSSGGAGLFAALVLATTPRLLMLARRIIIDMWITMFMGLTLVCFVVAELHPDRRKRYLVLMYVATGLGVLTKGPVAVVLPALAFLIYFVLERRPADLRRMMIPAGVAIVSLLVLPWYVALYAQHGWVHIKEFFIDENVLRYAAPVGAARRGWLFYVPVLFSDLFPWSILLPVALAVASGSFRRTVDPTDAAARAQRILLIWIVTIVLFFTFSQTKQDLYIFAIVPAEAALIGLVLARAAPRDQSRERLSVSVQRENASRALLWSLVATGALVTIVGIALLAFSVMAPRYRIAGNAAVGLVALGAGVAVLILAWRTRLVASGLALAVAFTVMSWILVLVSLPDFERYKPVAPFVDMIKQRATPGARIGYYRFAFPSMAFYVRRPVFEYFDAESLQQVFASGDEVHCLMTADDYASVQDALAGPTYVVARRPLFDVKLRTLLEGNALPDILLVSNRP